MNIIIFVLTLLLAIGAPIIWIVFAIKRKVPPTIIGPRGPRQRDGVLTYNTDRAMRFNIEVEDPRSTHNQRYQRRHASRRQKPTKPWMK